MSFSRYAIGLVLLVAVVGSAAFGAVRLRRRALPLWTGALARLAEATIALAIVLGVAELLGAVGLFRTATMVAGCVVAGAAVGISRWPRPVRQQPPVPPVPPLGRALALVGAVFVLAQWAAGTEPPFSGGMWGTDTIGYHGPIAATFVQQASIVHPPFVDTDPAIVFYPATSELVHAIGILLFSRDVLSPFINLAWLGLALLAAWCVGRPRGVGPASLLTAAVVLDAPVFTTGQPGTADNDVMALALLLTSLALLFNGYQPGRGGANRPRYPAAPVALAGIAAGFALATKATTVAPVGLLGIAVLIALPGARSRISWVLALVASSAVWFVRNLVAFGSPMPAVRIGIGSLSLPWAKVPGGPTVADYFTHGGFLRAVFLPGLHGGFTFIWPALLAAAFGGAILGMIRAPTRVERMLGPVAIIAAVAYAATPRTGVPLLFASELRHAGAAIVIGVALLFRVSPVSSVFRRPWVLVLLAAGVIVDLSSRGRSPSIGPFPLLGPTPHFGGTSAMWVGVAVAAALTLLVLTGRVVTVRGGFALGALAALGLAVWPAERTYLRTRYTTGPLAFARSIHHQRIAIVGYLQPYPAYGLDLSNSVTAIAHHGPHGAQTLINSCREWRRALTAGHYDYVITSGAYPLVFTSSPDYAAWTRGDPAVTAIRREADVFGGSISIVRIHGPMHPDLCAT